MSKQTKIVEKLNEYMLNKHLSQVDMAKHISIASGKNISHATISNMRNGKHEMISDEMWNTVALFLKIDNWAIVKTNNYATIINICDDAQANARMLAISAGSGFGKTTALRTYADSHPNVFYVLGNVLMQSKTSFLSAIQSSLGIAEGANAALMLAAIVRKLAQLENPLVIIDDAGKLNESNLRIIQLLYDQTEGACGIVLSGTTYLKNFLDKSKARGKMGMDELHRRIEDWEALNRPTDREIRAIATSNGITEVDTIKYICRASTNYGTVRAIIRNAMRLKMKNNLTLETLTKMPVQEEVEA